MPGRIQRLFSRRSRLDLADQRPFGIDIQSSTASDEHGNNERPQMWATAGSHPLPHQSRQEPTLHVVDIRLNQARGQLQREDMQRHQRRVNSSHERIRELRIMIREKRCLDIYVWGRREALDSDQGEIKEYCQKSDGLHDRIYAIIDAWEENDFSSEEWTVVKRIKSGMKRAAEDYTPWNPLWPWLRDTDESLLNGWSSDNMYVYQHETT